MSRPGPACLSLLAVAAFAVAGAMLASPASADDAVAVAFKADNPWMQEVASLSRSNTRNEYSVQVEAGKTLQINLVSRDPNVFFKVHNEATDEDLVDTFKTGATTWSTEVAAASKFTILVYVDPNAMQRDDVAKYALQIGRYGAKDMRAATTALTFQPGNPWVQVSGALDHRGAAQDYTIEIAAGKTLRVNLIARNPGIHFKVMNGDANATALVDTATTGATTWDSPVASGGNFTIHVYSDPSTLPRGMTVHYTLQVGQYGSGEAPAGAASVGAPAATMPATATTAGAG